MVAHTYNPNIQELREASMVYMARLEKQNRIKCSPFRQWRERQSRRWAGLKACLDVDGIYKGLSVGNVAAGVG